MPQELDGGANIEQYSNFWLVIAMPCTKSTNLIQNLEEIFNNK